MPGDRTPREGCHEEKQAGWDRLSLVGMVFYGHHGVDPAEQALGQKWEIDLDLYLDAQAASTSDELADAVDYAAVYGQVHQIMMEHRFHLAERLAGKIIESVLERFPVAGVRVKVRKIQPPIGGLVHAAEVEMERWRSPLQAGAFKPRGDE